MDETLYEKLVINSTV